VGRPFRAENGAVVAHQSPPRTGDQHPLPRSRLQYAKARQKDPAWQHAYRANRPVVERKISHFTRGPWGGRKARCRGQKRILTDILTRASALDLARLATLGMHHGPGGWAIA
jgi:hypothetical protein